jgi:putative membrane protein
MCGWIFFCGMGLPMIFDGIIMLLLWVVIIWGVLYLARDFRKGQESKSLQILGERYVRGEIDTDDYRTHIKVLHNDEPK